MIPLYYFLGGLALAGIGIVAAIYWQKKHGGEGE
jgi:hypothetical protein